jgi:hypothetical protein
VNGTEDDTWYSATSATPIGNVSSFDITGQGGQKLVTIPVNLAVGQPNGTGAATQR